MPSGHNMLTAILALSIKENSNQRIIIKNTYRRIYRSIGQLKVWCDNYVPVQEKDRRKHAIKQESHSLARRTQLNMQLKLCINPLILNHRTFYR